MRTFFLYHNPIICFPYSPYPNTRLLQKQQTISPNTANYFPHRALTGPTIILSVSYRKVKSSCSQSQPID